MLLMMFWKLNTKIPNTQYNNEDLKTHKGQTKNPQKRNQHHINWNWIHINKNWEHTNDITPKCVLVHYWRTPKSRVEPTWGFNYVGLRKVGTRKALPTSSTIEG